jgi:hypothetical protein
VPGLASGAGTLVLAGGHCVSTRRATAVLQLVVRAAARARVLAQSAAVPPLHDCRDHDSPLTSTAAAARRTAALALAAVDHESGSDTRAPCGREPALEDDGVHDTQQSTSMTRGTAPFGDGARRQPRLRDGRGPTGAATLKHYLNLTLQELRSSCAKRRWCASLPRLSRWVHAGNGTAKESTVTPLTSRAGDVCRPPRKEAMQ